MWRYEYERILRSYVLNFAQVDQNVSRYGVVYDRIRQWNDPFSSVYDDITVRNITGFTRKDMFSITAVNDRTVYDSFMASYTVKKKGILRNHKRIFPCAQGKILLWFREKKVSYETNRELLQIKVS